MGDPHRNPQTRTVSIVVLMVLLAAVPAVLLHTYEGIGEQQSEHNAEHADAPVDIGKRLVAFFREHQAWPQGDYQSICKAIDLPEPERVDIWGNPYIWHLPTSPDTPTSIDGHVVTGPVVWSIGPNRTNDFGGGDDIGNWHLTDPS